MKVKLISMTPNPIGVMWTAARTCYSAKSPIEMWDDRYGATSDDCEHTQEWIEQCVEGHWNLVKKVLDSGHQSIAEHVYFTFAIEGISRACSHQLVRHRAGIVFSQQSQRYVEIKENYQVVGDDGTVTNESNYLDRTDLIDILDRYFIWEHSNYAQFHSLLQALYCYLYQVQEMNIKPEDARQVLPNATKTNITMSLNYRELIHICNLRLCTRAQLEIRKLFQAIKAEVEGAEPRLAEYLRPNCEALGVCTEHQYCGRKPTLSEVLSTNKLLYEDETVLSTEDWAQLMDAIMKKPEVNQKLAEFMKGWNEPKTSLEIDKEDR